MRRNCDHQRIGIRERGPLTHRSATSSQAQFASDFYRIFRQAHRDSRKLVAEHIRPGDGYLRGLARFALQNQTTSEYPFVLEYSFSKSKQDLQKVSKIAAAVHLLQTSTLITDDVFDFADERYHQPAIHRRYDVSHAIIAAELFQTIAMETISRELSRPIFHNQVQVLTLFHKIIKDLYIGQHLDVFHTSNTEMTLAEYRRVIELGAGYFFESLARAGALLANKPKAHVEALATFGYNYGMGLFITDDVVDIAYDEKVTGKPLAPDLQARRMRLPIILALRMGEKGDRKWLKDFLRSKDNSKAVLREAANRIRKTGALDVSQMVANNYLIRSIRNLDAMKGTPTANALTQLAQRLVDASRNWSARVPTIRTARVPGPRIELRRTEPIRAAIQNLPLHLRQWRTKVSAS